MLKTHQRASQCPPQPKNQFEAKRERNMVTSKVRARLGGIAMITSLLLFSACGGNNKAPVVLSDPPTPQPQPAPQPAPQPVPDPTPAPQPAPDPTPAPPPADTVTLASTPTAITTQEGQNNWADGSGTGAAIDGINCSTNLVYHIHAMVAIYRDGVRLALPALIGLKGCTYETHTHDHSGVVHIEANVARTITLGQFFAVWGQPISSTSVAGIPGPVRVYVVDANDNLSRYDGDPAGIALEAHKEIVLITGNTTPIELRRYLWGGL